MSAEPIDGQFRWVIAKNYYDGETEGIAQAARGDICVYFHMVAWDAEYWERVFACAVVDCVSLKLFRKTLEKVGPGKEPFWLPGPEFGTPEVEAGWQELANAALKSANWELVSGLDLLGPVRIVTEIDPRTIELVADMVRHQKVIEIAGKPIIDHFLDQVRIG